jgi:diamine N-acetyltransferase
MNKDERQMTDDQKTDDRMTVRYASAADNILLAEMGARTFAGTFGKDNTPEDMAAYLAASFSPEKQSAELAEPGSLFLILEIDGQPAGYARLHQGPAPECIGGQKPIEIVRFYSVKEWIGRGVGRRLMQTCLDEADHQGCDVIWLDVWEKNPRAIAFYQKWGFVEAGRQTFQLGSDMQQDWLMKRAVG